MSHLCLNMFNSNLKEWSLCSIIDQEEFMSFMFIEKLDQVKNRDYGPNAWKNCISKTQSTVYVCQSLYAL